ncbi:MAG: ATP synthase F0 subunit A [Planctomycetota bacterium]|nr:MAG: ATP synthase F0 subunit A [Planctomycetota bacterium]
MAGDKIDMIHHVADGDKLEIFHWHISLPKLEIFGLDMSITKHVLFMWIAAALMLIIFISIARKESMVPRGWRNFFEAICEFLRDFVAKPYLHEDTNTYLPILWTFFFFILFCNLLGLIPFGATATGNIIVTGTLAVSALVIIKISAFLKHGPRGYLHALVPQVPGWLWPMMFVVEVLGWGAKTMALAVRLFANMLAGHIVILGFLSLPFIFKSYGEVVGYGVGIFSVAICVAIGCLELFVAFLQAFVFTFLTAVFLGMMTHPSH